MRATRTVVVTLCLFECQFLCFFSPGFCPSVVVGISCSAFLVTSLCCSCCPCAFLSSGRCFVSFSTFPPATSTALIEWRAFIRVSSRPDFKWTLCQCGWCSKDPGYSAHIHYYACLHSIPQGWVHAVPSFSVKLYKTLLKSKTDPPSFFLLFFFLPVLLQFLPGAADCCPGYDAILTRTLFSACHHPVSFIDLTGR